MSETEEPVEKATEALQHLAVEDRSESVPSTLDEEAQAQDNTGSSNEGEEHRGSSVPTDSGDNQTNHESRLIAKFLVNHKAAGSIIGKLGANITDLQSRSHARLQLSKANEYFPGTQDRVLIITGTLNNVIAAITLVMDTIEPELVMEHQNGNGNINGDRREAMRLLVPSASCGVLIGKLGATIQHCSTVSGASIGVSPQQDQLPGVSDRIALVTGTKPQILEALRLILQKLKDNAHYIRMAAVPVKYSSQNYVPWSAPTYPPPAMAPMPLQGHHHMVNGHMPMMQQVDHEIMIPVPDSRIGAIIGRGGEIITSLKTLFGVKIRVSNRDSFVPGTRNRKVILNGPPDAVSIAEQLIHQKVAAAGQGSASQNGVQNE